MRNGDAPVVFSITGASPFSCRIPCFRTLGADGNGPDFTQRLYSEVSVREAPERPWSRGRNPT